MRTFFLTAVLLCLLAAASAAQMGLGLNAYAGGGISFPLDDLNTYWQPAYHGMLGAGFSLTPGLEGVARYAYFAFPADEDVPPGESFADATDDFTAHEYGVDLRASLATPGFRFRPYGLVGAGFVKMPDDSKFFYCIGGGFKVTAFPKVNFFLEARYSRVSVDDFDVGYAPVTVGLNLAL